MRKNRENIAGRIPVRGRRRVQWRLMLIGDNGKIVNFRNYKIVSGCMLGALALSTAAAIILFFINLDIGRENEQIKEHLLRSEKLCQTLVSEKELLTARLVLAGIDADLGEMDAGEKRPDAPPEVPPESESEKKFPAENHPEMEDSDATEGVGPAAMPENEKRADDAPGISEIVAVENFEAGYDQGAGRMKARFKLDNISGEKLAGYIVVVMKDIEKEPNAFFAMPDAPLDEGRPSDWKAGRFFEISRFKTIRFSAENWPRAGKYGGAEVYIFGESGELLLKKGFSPEN